MLRTSTLLEGVDVRAQGVSTSLDANARTFLEGLDARTSTLLEGVDVRAQGVSSGFDANALALLEALDTRTAALLEGVDARARGVSAGLDANARTLLEALDVRSRALLEGVDARAKGVSEGFDASTLRFLPPSTLEAAPFSRAWIGVPRVSRTTSRPPPAPCSTTSTSVVSGWSMTSWVTERTWSTRSACRASNRRRRWTPTCGRCSRRSARRRAQSWMRWKARTTRCAPRCSRRSGGWRVQIRNCRQFSATRRTSSPALSRLSPSRSARFATRLPRRRAIPASRMRSSPTR